MDKLSGSVHESSWYKALYDIHEFTTEDHDHVGKDSVGKKSQSKVYLDFLNSINELLKSSAQPRVAKMKL